MKWIFGLPLIPSSDFKIPVSLGLKVLQECLHKFFYDRNVDLSSKLVIYVIDDIFSSHETDIGILRALEMIFPDKLCLTSGDMSIFLQMVFYLLIF